MTRLALIGAGFMGRLHAEAIAASDVARLVLVVDPDPAARGVADRHGARWSPLLDGAADEVDGFVVALPDRHHVDTAVALLEAGGRVLLEKPLADTLEGAQRIARAARDGGGRLLAGHILRHDPRYAEAAEAVAAGRIGEVLHVTSGRLAPQSLGERMNGTSSVLFYLGIHDADLVAWLSGHDVTRVYARAVAKRMAALGMDSEDAIVTTCELAGGAVGQLYAGWTLRDDVPAPVNARTMVVGTEGSIEIDVRDHGLRIHDGDGYRQPDALHWPRAGGRLTGDLVDQLRHFVGAIARDEPFHVSVDDALRAVAVNDAILRSVASGRPEDVRPWSVA